MSDEKKMRAFFEALADNVDNLSDDEVLAEAREEGRSPEEIANQMRSFIQNTVKAFKQRPLVEAQRERERSLERMKAAKHRLPPEPRVRREWLAAMMARPEAQGMLTAHGRDFTELTDEDVEQSILELMHLGMVPPDEKPEE
jgi:hypothetical protein